MNTKNQIALLIGGCIVIVLLLLVFLVYPFFASIRKDSSGLADVKKELDIISDRSGEIEVARTDCNELDSYLEKAENLFVDIEVPVRLIEFLENNAKSLNLDIDIFPMSLKEAGDDIWEFVGFRLNLTGLYNNFVRFLKHVEAGPFLIEIKDTSIRALSESEQRNNEQLSSGDITATLVIKVFAKKYED